MNSKTDGTQQRWWVRYAPLWLTPVAILLAVFLMEGVLRAKPELLPERAKIKRLYQQQTNINSVGDPYLGFVYPPFYTVEVKSLDFDFQIASDEHGFRNDSPWPEQADVVVVGDSMVYGWGVEREESWVSLVAKHLPEQRIINLGLPGTSPQQYVRYFERFGLPLKPKLIVFGLFAGNDLVGAEVFDRWVAAGSPGNFDKWRFFAGEPPGPIRSALERSHVVLLTEAVLKDIGQAYGSQALTTGEGRKLQLVPGVYARAMRLTDPNSPAFRSVIATAREARDLAQGLGAKFVVVLFPTKEEIYLPLLDVEFPSLTQPLARVLAAEGIDAIDLTDAFRMRAADDKKLFFRIDGHPNQHGNFLIAKQLAPRIRELLNEAGSPP